MILVGERGCSIRRFRHSSHRSRSGIANAENTVDSTFGKFFLFARKVCPEAGDVVRRCDMLSSGA